MGVLADVCGVVAVVLLIGILAFIVVGLSIATPSNKASVQHRRTRRRRRP
jgi:hypothetical protein